MSSDIMLVDNDTYQDMITTRVEEYIQLFTATAVPQLSQLRLADHNNNITRGVVKEHSKTED